MLHIVSNYFDVAGEGRLLLLCYSVKLRAISGFLDLAHDILSNKVGATHNSSANCDRTPVPLEPPPCG